MKKFVYSIFAFLLFVGMLAYSQDKSGKAIKDLKKDVKSAAKEIGKAGKEIGKEIAIESRRVAKEAVALAQEIARQSEIRLHKVRDDIEAARKRLDRQIKENKLSDAEINEKRARIKEAERRADAHEKSLEQKTKKLEKNLVKTGS